METKICPYPGLRPFTEEEGLFFKGREKHVRKIMDELSATKFLMVTGASGDGKSSLIFAGLLPNVRAGFFRGLFAKWAVVVFRPGHSPLKALSSELSNVIKEKSAQAIASELNYGYSALVDAYKQSSLFLNTDNSEFTALDEKEQKAQKRKASNLLIVVDQFEEFFTNNENFNKETAIPSVEAQLVMNILLETVNIAKTKNIPIYIVCTMRSDYIGNAPAYRGLPEIIGDNQFFVPRLNRDEIQKVIVEPSELSGNKISFRLVQRLINDLDVVNTDVLPSLQHTLRQIWQLADKGNSEMDIIHYAMAGGMSHSELSSNDLSKFNDWFQTIPDYHKQLFDNESFGVSNVLNQHARLIYETAHLDCGFKITKEQSQRIIQKAFKSLTQIDDSKAVRHRITLGKMTEIVKEEGITSDKLCSLLNIYRKQGNTLIYPFITEPIENADSKITIDNLSPLPLEGAGGRSILKPDTLLDITHEALIRNWKQLTLWTKEEYESGNDFRELNVMMERWNNTSKIKGNLLPEGTCNYFINWYGTQQPTAEWISRYINQAIYISDGRAEKLIDGQEIIEQSKQHEVATKKITDLQSFLQLSKLNNESIKRRRKIIFTTITTLCSIAVLVSILATYMQQRAVKLKNEIELTAKSNLLATQAYTSLEKDPTLAFRIAEQAYKIYPTPLSKQVLFAAYGEIPFYKKLSGHKEGVLDCKISPDGKYIATFSTDNTGIIWDFDGNKIAELKGHTEPTLSPQFDCMNFSPDSKYIITGTNDSTVRIWEIPPVIARNEAISPNEATSTPQAKCLAIMKHNNIITSVSFSPVPINLPVNFAKVSNFGKVGESAEHLILTSSYDSTARLWNMQGKELLKIKHKNPVSKAIFSPDGKLIATNIGKTINIWDLKGKLLCELKGHKSRIYDMLFSPDNNYIITVSTDSTAKIWNTNGKLLQNLKGHTNGVFSVDISPDMKYIVTGSDDNTIRLWDFTGKQLAIMRKHTLPLWSTKFSPDGKYIASASDDGTARLWDLSGTELMCLKGHTTQVMAAEFSPDSKYIVTASNDKTARIWNIQPLEYPVMRGHSGYVADINQSNDGKHIATAAWDYTARLWDLSGKMLQIMNYPYRYAIRTSDFFNKSENIVISIAGEFVIYGFKGKQIKKVPTNGNYSSLDISKNDNLLWWGDDYKASLYDTTGKKLQEFKDVSSASFIAENDSFITTVGLDSTLYFWVAHNLQGLQEQMGGDLAGLAKDSNKSVFDSQTKNPVILSKPDTSLYQIFHKINLGTQTSAYFSDNLKYMLTLSEDSTARLWDFEKICSKSSVLLKSSVLSGGEQLADNNKQQTNIKQQTGLLLAWKFPNQILSALFAPDNQHFAIIDDKNQILIYNIEELQKEIASFLAMTDERSQKSEDSDQKILKSLNPKNPSSDICSAHTDAINDINFSADSKYLVSGSNDYSFILWNINGELIQTYNLHKAGVKKAKFTKDGKYILTASRDHTARITPVSIEMVFYKINKQKVRGNVEELTEDEMKIFGIK